MENINNDKKKFEPFDVEYKGKPLTSAELLQLKKEHDESNNFHITNILIRWEIYK